MPPRPIRIAFVVRSFTFGGAEHDVIQLMTESDPRVLTCVGMAVQTPFPICPDLPLDHPRVPTLYQPGGATRHRKIVRRGTFTQAVARLAERADVLIAWGVPDLDEVIPASFRGHVVATSKASGAYQESFLHPNALLTTNYVANSVKSVEAFPAAVRDRVRVIYPGVQPQRIARTMSRERQRKAWGIGRGDLVVGYLGRIAPDKGVEPLVEAVRTMDRRWKAVFVGRNGNFAEYERRFAELCRERLPERARMIDWTTDVGSAISAFDVLAYPTVEEGFANSLVEAWRLGVPTVATEGVGALAESRWAGCAIRVRLNFTPRELARAIVAARGKKSLVKRAQRAASGLTIPAAMAAWQDYFVELVERPQRMRAMVLLPNALVGGIPAWLLTLMRHTPDIDWVSVGIVSETPEFSADAAVVDDILARGCPVYGIPRLPAGETQARLLRAIRQTRPDVILQAGVRDLDRAFPQTGVPLVAVSHGPVDCAWARIVLRKSSRCARHHTAVSATAAEAYHPNHRARVQIITNGVEVPKASSLQPDQRRRVRKRLGLRTGEIAVGFVGRLSPEKNPVGVARAVSVLPREYRGVFIGPDCGMLTKIERTTRRFIHVPAVPLREAHELMPGLDVLVCLSEYESFGLAIAEAWAARVPVVSTRVGIVAELIDEIDVAVTVPFAPKAQVVAGAIRQAIAERLQRGERCRLLVQRHLAAARMGRDWQEYLRGIVRDEEHNERGGS